jgi:hypothetical protein
MASVDTSASFPHPRLVLTSSRRVSALFLTLALSASPVALCAGWMATPEARMACCSERGACPMHKSGSHESGRQRVTQAEADRCCAASEREATTQSTQAFSATMSSAVLGSAIILPFSVPALVLSDAWRTVAPIPGTPVPKHVLLSVFLL